MSGELHLPGDLQQQMAQQQAMASARVEFVVTSAMQNLAARMATLPAIGAGQQLQGDELRRLVEQVQREAKLAKIAAEALAIEFGLIRPRGNDPPAE